MRRLSPILSLSILTFAGLFCGCGARGDASPVIATIKGAKVHKSEFDRFLALKIGELNDVVDATRSQMLDEYLTRRVVLAEAARANIKVTEEDLEQAAVENPQIKSTASTEEARKEALNDLMIAKYYHQTLLNDVKVSKEEVQQYMEKNRARLADRPAFYVREIRVDAQAEAARLYNEVTQGNRDFGDIARLHSHAPSAEQGGLARYTEGQLPAVLERTILRLNPGDVSPVVQSSYGYHIFKLERRVQTHANEERRAQLDEQQSKLLEELISQKNQDAVDQAIARMISAADVTIFESALGFTYTGKLGHN